MLLFKTGYEYLYFILIFLFTNQVDKICWLCFYSIYFIELFISDFLFNKNMLKKFIQRMVQCHWLEEFIWLQFLWFSQRGANTCKVLSSSKWILWTSLHTPYQYGYFYCMSVSCSHSALIFFPLHYVHCFLASVDQSHQLRCSSRNLSYFHHNIIIKLVVLF